MHHPPYSSSSTHGSTPELQWPYAAWGANAVLAGHDHTYERIERDGILYFVNGIGGAALYPIGTPVEGSQVRYNADYGAMLIEATSDLITYRQIDRTGAQIDYVEQRIENVQRSPLPALGLVEQRVVGSDNDAEENVATGAVNLTSTDLEFTTDPNQGAQVVGMRFAGLLLERSPGVFTFPHRTFQEYLAGAHLSTQSDCAQQATALGAQGALWREVVLLCLLYTSPSPRDRTRSRMPSSA